MSHLKKQAGSAHVRHSGSRSSRSSGKGLLIAIIVIVVVIFGGGALLGPTMGQCREVIGDFQDACNDMDASEMLGVLKPTIANPLRLALFAGGAITDTDTSEILPQILDAFGGGFSEITDLTGMAIEEAMKQVKIRPYLYGFPGPSRKVSCKVTVAGMEMYMKITIRRYHFEPYIAKVQFD